MPILDIQSRFRELGRIRTGRKVPTKNHRLRPEKLARFRLTSPWRHLVEQAAERFGGTPAPWDNGGAEEWEVIVEADTLPVVVPPGEILEQWYELWTGGGCARRCDGVNQVLAAKPCACPKDPLERQELAADGKACKPTTRLRVMIPDVSDLGTWRLESHGFHAAAELGGAAGLVEAATRRGAMIPADLRLQAREGVRRPGQQTRKFFVPTLSFRGALGPTLEALGVLDADASMPVLLGADPGKPSLEAGGRGALPPAGTAFDPAPTEAPSFPGAAPALEAPREAHQEPASEPIDVPSAPTPAPEAFAPEEAAQSVSEPERLPETEPFDPPAPVDERERSYSGPQIIAMRFDARGIRDRNEKLAVIRTLLRRDVSSAKDLSTDEVRIVLQVVNDDAVWTELLEEHRTKPYQVAEDSGDPAPEPTPTETPSPSSAESPSASSASRQHVPAEAVEVVETPRPAPGAGADGPRGWTVEQWRSYLRDAGVKVSEVVREAARLAKDHNVRPAPTSIESIVGSGLEEQLAGFVEDRRK